MVVREGEAPLGGEVWADTHRPLPPDLHGRGWRNMLTGEALPAAETLPLTPALANFPVALLLAE